MLGAQPAPNPRKKKNLTAEGRLEALAMMMAVSEVGRFPHGAMKKFSAKLGVARSTLWRLWKSSAASRAHGRVLSVDVFSRKKLLCGAKKKYNPDDVLVALKQIPKRHRRTLRSTASHLGVSYSTVHNLRKNKSIRPHISSLKPHLTEQHKVARLAACLDEVDQSTMQFVDMYDRIHIDEKWFFLTKDAQRYYLAHDEAAPHRTVKHKKHILKVRRQIKNKNKNRLILTYCCTVTGNVHVCTSKAAVQ
jgi:hypothetical protein